MAKVLVIFATNSYITSAALVTVGDSFDPCVEADATQLVDYLSEEADLDQDGVVAIQTLVSDVEASTLPPITDEVGDKVEVTEYALPESDEDAGDTDD